MIFHMWVIILLLYIVVGALIPKVRLQGMRWFEHIDKIKGRPIFLDLAYRRLRHISKEKIKILVGGGATGF
jgi:hypothetical protein